MAATAHEREWLALYGLQHHLAPAFLDLLVNVGFGEAPWHDMVGQNFGQRRLVFRLQQRLHRPCRQTHEGLVVGAKPVKGPAPSSVSTRPAALTAATSVV